PKDLRNLLAAIAAAGLIYVPFALVEMRMSPQFHNWVYGYQQHSFLQTMRWGGYRPMGVMAHGLALARFVFVGMLAALIVSREKRAIFGIPTKVAAAILFVTLVFCKSTGAIAFALIGLLVVLACTSRVRQAVAVVLAVIVLLYPVLRTADL